MVELHDLLAQTMAIDAARSWLLDRKIVANEVGLGLVDPTRGYLDTLEPRALAELLIGGMPRPRRTCRDRGTTKGSRDVRPRTGAEAP